MYKFLEPEELIKNGKLNEPIVFVEIIYTPIWYTGKVIDPKIKLNIGDIT